MKMSGQRGVVSPGLIYGGAAVIVLALGVGVFLMRNKSSDSVPVATPSSPSTQAPETASPETPAADPDKDATALEDARLSGTWKLTFQVKSSSVSALADASDSFVYTMDPKCGTGSCTTSMGGDPAIDLRQRGAKYKGSVATKDTATCSGTALASRMTVALKVQRADTVDGEWSATKMSGKGKQTGAAQSGCPAYTVTYSIKGKPTSDKATSGTAWPTVPQTRPTSTTTDGGNGGGGGGGTDPVGNG